MSERQRLPRLRRGSGENHTSDHKMKQENMKMMFLQLVAKNPVSWSGVWNGQGSAPRGGTDGRSGLHCRGWCERRWRMRTTAQVSDALPVLDSKLSRLRLRGTNNMSVRNRLVCCRLGDTTSTFWCFNQPFLKSAWKEAAVVLSSLLWHTVYSIEMVRKNVMYLYSAIGQMKPFN